MRIAFFNHQERIGIFAKDAKIGGGGNIALIRMMEELVKLGHEVYFFSNGSGFYERNGVKYIPIIFPMIKNTEWDYLISHRNSSVFLMEVKAKKKILWLHDYWSSDSWKLLNDSDFNIDEYWVVSEYHKRKLLSETNISPGKVWVTKNGVDLDMFDFDIRKEKNRLIYASPPGRGLALLIDIFPEIKRRVREAELYIFSSNKLYGLSDQHFEGLINLAKSMEGVHYNETLSQREIIKEYAKSTLMVYPCIMPETYCMAAKECIVSGTPVICLGNGALPDTVGKYGIVIKPSDNARQEFIEAVVMLLKDDRKIEKLRESPKNFFTWEQIAKEWNDRMEGVV